MQRNDRLPGLTYHTWDALIAPKRPPRKITRAYVRHYSDSGQCTAYVEWSDGSRTEGPARGRQPIGEHMNALFDRAIREGAPIRHEEW